MTAIWTKNISKKYGNFNHPTRFLRVFLRLRNLNYFEMRWALRNINLTVPKGQTCALMGVNGSGKSTLLGLLSGIIAPTDGQLKVVGKMSSLLELGAGFQPELTGRENISLSAGILGLSKVKIRQRINDIIEFSEIGNHIDKPVRTLSTGMLLRLGFSIAVHIDFDILLIDEILSVGDLSFRRKCISKMRHFKKMGKTILLASHSLSDVAAFCDRVLLIEQGRIALDGPVEEVLGVYWEKCEKEQNQIHEGRNPFKAHNVYGDATGVVKITGVRFLNSEGVATDTFHTKQAMVIRIRFFSHKKIQNPLFRVQFFRNDGLWVHGANTYRSNYDSGTVRGPGEIELIYNSLNLLEADYYISIGVWPNEYKSFLTNVAYDLHEMAYVIHIKSSRENGGGIVHNPFRWNLIAIKDQKNKVQLLKD